MNALEETAISERTWRATRGRPPLLRMTQTDYFRGQHHEIPAKMVTGNPAVNGHGVSATPENVSRCRRGRFPHPGPLPVGEGDRERATRHFHRKSFSRCGACHRRAEQGVFNEHEVRIPGYGRFND